MMMKDGLVTGGQCLQDLRTLTSYTLGQNKGKTARGRGFEGDTQCSLKKRLQVGPAERALMVGAITFIRTALNHIGTLNM